MGIEKGNGSLLPELHSLHKEQGIFICDISDAPGDIELYKPGSKEGMLVSGKPRLGQACLDGAGTALQLGARRRARASDAPQVHRLWLQRVRPGSLLTQITAPCWSSLAPISARSQMAA